MNARERGTCPYCERRVGVGVPHAGTRQRRVGRHRLPARQALLTPTGACPGSGDVCQEDRVPALAVAGALTPEQRETVAAHRAADRARGRDWAGRQGCGCAACLAARAAAGPG